MDGLRRPMELFSLVMALHAFVIFSCVILQGVSVEQGQVRGCVVRLFLGDDADARLLGHLFHASHR